MTFEHLTSLCVLLWWQIFVSYDSKWGPRKLHQTHLLLNNINVKCSKETMVWHSENLIIGDVKRTGVTLHTWIAFLSLSVPLPPVSWHCPCLSLGQATCRHGACSLLRGQHLSEKNALHLNNEYYIFQVQQAFLSCIRNTHKCISYILSIQI